MSIKLKDIWPIENVGDYKVHFARRVTGEDGIAREPLNVWLSNKCDWVGWQKNRPQKNEFNREFIFSLMRFYSEEDVWLFGGIFRVLADHGYGNEYEVELTNHGADFIGRLKIFRVHRIMATRVNLENHYDDFEISEILREPYSGRIFPGYENIDLPFKELATLIRNDKPDWKSALENVKGVYLITDTSTGKRYVGSAYGDQGIWSRWEAYVRSGHGWNKELQELVGDKLDYAQENFKFTLLEYRPAPTPDGTVIYRENYWKEVLLMRGKYGLNQN